MLSGKMYRFRTDIFWLADLDNLPDPKDLAEEIVENIEAGLNNFRAVLAALGK